MEGIPENQWCFEPNDKKEFGNGMKIKPNATSLAGYRLPTEVEWEYASSWRQANHALLWRRGRTVGRNTPGIRGTQANHAAPGSQTPTQRIWSLSTCTGTRWSGAWVVNHSTISRTGSPSAVPPSFELHGEAISSPIAGPFGQQNGLPDRPAVNNSGGFRIARGPSVNPKFGLAPVPVSVCAVSAMMIE